MAMAACQSHSDKEIRQTDVDAIQEKIKQNEKDDEYTSRIVSNLRVQAPTVVEVTRVEETFSSDGGVTRRITLSTRKNIGEVKNTVVSSGEKQKEETKQEDTTKQEDITNTIIGKEVKDTKAQGCFNIGIYGIIGVGVIVLAFLVWRKFGGLK